MVSNDVSLVHNSTGDLTIASLDICQTPSPGGPIPIPYPNIGMASDTAKGTKSVKVSNPVVGLKGDAHYKMSESDE